MRWLLILTLAQGLVPGLAEAGEAVVHYLQTGHLAHTAADRGDLGDQGAEHGCGTTQHRCTCCTAQALAPAPTTAVETVLLATRFVAPPVERVPASSAPARPFRPPIA